MILKNQEDRMRQRGGTAAYQRKMLRKSSSLSSACFVPATKNAGVGHQLPYAKYYSSKQSNGSQSSIQCRNKQSTPDLNATSA